MKNLILHILLLILFSSCKTVVYFNRTAPPELVLGKQQAQIFFINRFDYQNNPRIKDKHEVAYKLAIEEFGKALKNVEQPDTNLVIFHYDSTQYNQISNNMRDTAMMKNEIKSLCKTNNADYFLSLDSLHLFFDWEVIRDEDTDGSVSKSKEFYLISNYYVTLYDSAYSFKHSNNLGRSIFYASRPTLGALITIKPNLDNAKQKIQKLATGTAQQYVGLFYPSVGNDEMRELNAGKVFKETNSLIISNQYDQAIKLLEEMTNTLKPKLAAKAHHNLDVAKELKQNNLKVSKIYSNFSYSL